MVNTILEMRGISKSFPGAQALQGVSLRLWENTVIGLVGENGAGKSTLMKILVGLYSADEGEIELRGELITPRTVEEAARHGIGMVFQEQALLDNITVAENIFLGKEEPFVRHGLIRWEKMHQAACEQLEELGSNIPPDANTGKLSFSQRQTVEVARVMALASRSNQIPIIIFDEPTTVGSQDDVQRLLETIRTLKRRATIVFISHRLEEVLEIADHIYVLKDGRNVSDKKSAETSPQELYQLMVGREKRREYYHESQQVNPQETVILELRNCSLQGSFSHVDLELRRGEILGVCGVLGSGKEELCRAVAGITPFTEGKVYVEGKPVTLRTPLDARNLGIGYVPMERRKEGLIQYFGVAPNITLPNPRLIVRNGLLSRRREKAVSSEWVERLGIKTSSLWMLAMTLSGGNQQKVVLAKWLAARVKLLILDHPTRGIDVGAKEEVYGLLRQLAKEGLSMLLTSDTLSEAIALSNRLVVMKDGQVQAILCAPIDQKPDEVQVIKHMM